MHAAACHCAGAHADAQHTALTARAQSGWRPCAQVEWSEALLLHPPETVTVNMAVWRGHFGTLMPFYIACEAAGGFVGSAQRTVPPPVAIPGAAEATRRDDLEAAGAVALEELQLYNPPKRADGSVADWGAPIRCETRLV